MVGEEDKFVTAVSWDEAEDSARLLLLLLVAVVVEFDLILTRLVAGAGAEPGGCLMLSDDDKVDVIGNPSINDAAFNGCCNCDCCC